jgi:hypothetical protein
MSDQEVVAGEKPPQDDGIKSNEKTEQGF